MSHLSGTATLVGTGLIHGQLSTNLHLLGILLSFLLGAVLSGVLISSSTLKIGRHYDSLLLIEGIVLLVSIFLLEHHTIFGHFSASFCCGLQNAMVTSYSGAVIRTTHVTGLFTDLGLMLGARMRGESLDKRKALLFTILVTGFISGGSAGALLFSAFGFYALVAPGGTCLLLAGMYRVYARNKKE